MTATPEHRIREHLERRGGSTRVTVARLLGTWGLADDPSDTNRALVARALEEVGVIAEPLVETTPVDGEVGVRIADARALRENRRLREAAARPPAPAPRAEPPVPRARPAGTGATGATTPHADPTGPPARAARHRGRGHRRVPVPAVVHRKPWRHRDPRAVERLGVAVVHRRPAACRRARRARPARRPRRRRTARARRRRTRHRRLGVRRLPDRRAAQWRRRRARARGRSRNRTVRRPAVARPRRRRRGPPLSLPGGTVPPFRAGAGRATGLVSDAHHVPEEHDP